VPFTSNTNRQQALKRIQVGIRENETGREGGGGGGVTCVESIKKTVCVMSWLPFRKVSVDGSVTKTTLPTMSNSSVSLVKPPSWSNGVVFLLFYRK
jgi:hypothetical protein